LGKFDKIWVKFDSDWAKIKILHPKNIRSPSAMHWSILCKYTENSKIYANQFKTTSF